MNPSAPKDRSSNSTWVLRRLDQAGVAAMAAVAVVTMVVWWSWNYRIERRLVEFGRAESRQVRFEIDPNRAEWPELAQLPGIGETLARRIVESRELDEPFSNCDQLSRVRGIGEKKLDAVRPYLRPMAGMETHAK